jgi:hypothetical protein
MSRLSFVNITGYVRRVSWHNLDLPVDHELITAGLFIRSLCRRLSTPGFTGMLPLISEVGAHQRAALILPARAADKSVAVQLFPPIGHIPTELLGAKPKESLRPAKFSR